MNAFASRFLLMGVLLLYADALLAQMNHYWSEQYGNKSMLLGNSMIGGVDDLAAVYYNPARLAQISNPAFLLSADVYQWNRLRLEDITGDNVDINKSEITGAPTMAAGTFRIGGFFKRFSFAYAVYQRYSTELNFTYKNEVYDNVLDFYPGNEWFGAEASFNSKNKDRWLSFTWAYAVKDNFSVGITPILSYTEAGKQNRIELQALSNANQASIYRFNRTYNYKQTSILFKAGASWIFNGKILGITLAAPQINVKNKGSFLQEEFLSGPSAVTDSIVDIYGTNNQSNLNIKVKSPLSLGIGFTLPIGRSKLHFGSEWYSKVPRYTLMEATPRPYQSGTDTSRLVIRDAYRHVINASVGTEVFLSDRISLYGSISTDFSANDPEEGGFISNDDLISSSSITANFYHASGGIVLHAKGVDLTLGANYTGAEQPFNRPVNFPDEEGEDILDTDAPGTVSLRRVRIIFSFSVPFLEDYAKDVEKRLFDKQERLKYREEKRRRKLERKQKK